jgi:hypothetical protein
MIKTQKLGGRRRGKRPNTLYIGSKNNLQSIRPSQRGTPKRLGADAPRRGGLQGRWYSQGTIRARIATWKSQRIDGRPRPRSGRRPAVASGPPSSSEHTGEQHACERQHRKCWLVRSEAGRRSVAVRTAGPDDEYWQLRAQA